MRYCHPMIDGSGAATRYRSRCRRLVRLACTGVAILAVAACSILPEARETFYYAIEYEDLNLDRAPADFGIARVLEPAVASAYDRRQMVLRTDSPRFQYLNDDLWGVELRESLRMLIERFYADVPTFDRVLGEFDRGSARYEIHSSIRRVEYIQGDPSRTRVEIVIEARTATGTPTTIAQHETRYDEETSGGGGLENFVRDVNRIMIEAVAGFDDALRERGAGS